MADPSLATATTYLISSGATTVISIPGTPTEGQFVWMQIGGDRVFTGFTSTVPIEISTLAGAATTPGSQVKYHIQGPTPVTGFTVVNDQTGGCLMVADIRVYDDVDPDNPFAATGMTQQGATGMPAPPSATATATGLMSVVWGALDDDEITDTTAATGWTNLQNQETTGGGSTLDATIMSAEQLITSTGTYSPAAFGGSGSDDWIAGHLLLRGVSGATEYPVSGTASYSFDANITRAGTTSKVANYVLGSTTVRSTALSRAVSYIFGASAVADAITDIIVSVTASYSFTATTVRQAGLSLLASPSFAGSITRAMTTAFSASLSFVASAVRQLAFSTSAAYEFSASMVKSIGVVAAASYSLAASVVRQAGVVLANSFSFAASVTVDATIAAIQMVLTAAYSLSASISRSTSLNAIGSFILSATNSMDASIQAVIGAFTGHAGLGIYMKAKRGWKRRQRSWKPRGQR